LRTPNAAFFVHVLNGPTRRAVFSSVQTYFSNRHSRQSVPRIADVPIEARFGNHAFFVRVAAISILWISLSFSVQIVFSILRLSRSSVVHIVIAHIFCFFFLVPQACVLFWNSLFERSRASLDGGLIMYSASKVRICNSALRLDLQDDVKRRNIADRGFDPRTLINSLAQMIAGGCRMLFIDFFFSHVDLVLKRSQ